MTSQMVTYSFWFVHRSWIWPMRVTRIWPLPRVPRLSYSFSFASSDWIYFRRRKSALRHLTRWLSYRLLAAQSWESRSSLLWCQFLICCCCLVPKLHLPLCDPMDYSLPGSSTHGILQTRILEWVAISYSRGSSWPRDWTCISCVSCIGRWILYHCTTWEIMPRYPFLMHLQGHCGFSLSHYWQ